MRGEALVVFIVDSLDFVFSNLNFNVLDSSIYGGASLMVERRIVDPIVRVQFSGAVPFFQNLFKSENWRLIEWKQ
jgi:hypothetical protein